MKETKESKETKETKETKESKKTKQKEREKTKQTKKTHVPKEEIQKLVQTIVKENVRPEVDAWLAQQFAQISVLEVSYFLA